MSSLSKIKHAKSLEQLSAACREAALLIPREVNELTKEAAASLAFNLIYKTPVDTSLALSNWRIGLMFPEAFPVPAYVKGEEGSTAPISRAAAFHAAQSALRPKLAGTPVFVSNNAAHIVELNEGKSAQADAGFVQSITAEVAAETHIKLREYVNGN